MRAKRTTGSGPLSAVAAALLSVCAGAMPAAAQGAAQIVGYLDLDHDGQVSLNEYLTFQQPRLAQFDANADGQLQEKEFKGSLDARAQKNAERSFKAFNRRGNALDQEEFLGYHAFVFKTFVDQNRDGFLSTDELAKLQDAG